MQRSVVNISSWYEQERKKDYHRKTKNGDLLKGLPVLIIPKGYPAEGEFLDILQVITEGKSQIGYDFMT